MLSEEPFAHHILDMTDGNEESTIYDYLYQNLSITIEETWTYLTCETKRSPKISKEFLLIVSLEQNSEYGKFLRQISHEKNTHLGKSCMTMKYLMNRFYETNEFSDVICDEYSNASGTEQKSNFETKQSVVKAPM